MKRTATDLMRRRSRLFVMAAFLVATVSFGVIAASGISDNLVYYWTPSDLWANGDRVFGASIRLGGMVAPGSIRRTENSSSVEFDVYDGKASVHVKSSGAPPQMFRENIGVVVEGTMVRDGWFESKRLMVSHGNEYKAPKSGHPVDRNELRRLMQSTDGLAKQP